MAHLQCVWCCVTAQSGLQLWPWSLCEEPCRRGSRLYVPSQVPLLLSLHAHGRREGASAEVTRRRCSAPLSWIFFYVGPHLCELCALFVLSGRVSVWLPVHSCQVRLAFKAAVLSWLLAGRTRPAPLPVSRVSFLSSLRPFSVPADVLNTCSELLFICSSSFGGCAVWQQILSSLLTGHWPK